MVGGKQGQGGPPWFRYGGAPQAIRFLLSLLLLLNSAERCHGFTSLQHQWELAVQLVAVAVTNFFMALPIYAAWKACLVLDVVVATFALSSSIIYHSLQAVEHYRGRRRIYFLGGSSLNWQKADSVFAFACFSALLLQPLQITRPALLVGVQAVTLCLSSTAQNVGSWNMWCLFVSPVAGSALCLVVGLCMRAWHSKLPIVTNKGYLLGAGFSLPVAFAFFLLGLDDNTDYLRLKHGMWHAMVSLTGFCIVRAFNPPVVVAQRRALMLGPPTWKHQGLFGDLLGPGSPGDDPTALVEPV